MSIALSRLLLAAGIGLAGIANAAVTFVDLGTVAPPATLGSCAASAFSQVAQAAVSNGTSVTSVPGGPSGTTLALTSGMTKAAIGSGWATWSHGYTGAVYWAAGLSQTVTLPPGAQCFYLYVEPNNNGSFNITVTPSTGAAVTRPVTGSSGAYGYGFYATGENLLSVTVDAAAGSGGFAIGEFGLGLPPAPGFATPVPATGTEALVLLFLLLTGAAALVLRGRRH